MSNEPTCHLCGAKAGDQRLVPAALVRPSILEEIRKVQPSWRTDGYICQRDLNEFRGRYIHAMLVEDRGELSRLEREVYESLKQHEIVTSNVEEQFQQELTFG